MNFGRNFYNSDRKKSSNTISVFRGYSLQLQKEIDEHQYLRQKKWGGMDGALILAKEKGEEKCRAMKADRSPFYMKM